jgi:hypothetical protein
MGVWQGVVMDSLKFNPAPPCPTLLRSASGTPPQGGRPAAVFTLLDTPRRSPMSLDVIIGDIRPGVAMGIENWVKNEPEIGCCSFLWHFISHFAAGET